MIRRGPADMTLDNPLGVYTLTRAMETDPRCIAASRYCTASQLRRATRVVSRIFEEVMASSGLEGTQFTLLVALSLGNGVPMRTLAERLGVDRTTLTRNLKPLEREGLVETGAGDDQRVRLVRMTAKGRRVLEKALPLWEKAQHQVVSKLGRAKWESLLGLLDAVRALG
jgi:DNA-binding MarR family transcriptional regulator